MDARARLYAYMHTGNTCANVSTYARTHVRTHARTHARTRRRNTTIRRRKTGELGTLYKNGLERRRSREADRSERMHKHLSRIRGKGRTVGIPCSPFAARQTPSHLYSSNRNKKSTRTHSYAIPNGNGHTCKELQSYYYFPS
jgi:hypothetical protein